MNLERFKEELGIKDNKLAEQLFKVRAKGEEISFPSLQKQASFGNLEGLRQGDNLSLEVFVLGVHQAKTKTGEEMKVLVVTDRSSTLGTVFLFQKHAELDLKNGDFLEIDGARFWRHRGRAKFAVGPEAVVEKKKSPIHLSNILRDGLEEPLEDRRVYKFKNIWGLAERTSEYEGCPNCLKKTHTTCPKCGSAEKAILSFKSVYATDGRIQLVINIPPNLQLEEKLTGAKFSAVGGYRKSLAMIEAFNIDIAIPALEHNYHIYKEVSNILDIHRAVEYKDLLEACTGKKEFIDGALAKLSAEQKIMKNGERIRRI